VFGHSEITPFLDGFCQPNSQISRIQNWPRLVVLKSRECLENNVNLPLSTTFVSIDYLTRNCALQEPKRWVHGATMIKHAQAYDHMPRGFTRQHAAVRNDSFRKLFLFFENTFQYLGGISQDISVLINIYHIMPHFDSRRSLSIDPKNSNLKNRKIRCRIIQFKSIFCDFLRFFPTYPIRHWQKMIVGALVTWAIYTQGQLLLWSSLIVTGVVLGYK